MGGVLALEDVDLGVAEPADPVDAGSRSAGQDRPRASRQQAGPVTLLPGDRGACHHEDVRLELGELAEADPSIDCSAIEPGGEQLATVEDAGLRGGEADGER